MADPIVTAIVSTYNSERFIRNCLDDLVAQTLGEALEIIVIDSHSLEGEGAIVKEFQQQHANIRYLRTDVREDTSEAFNRAIAIARGRYLTNANTDDGHRADAFELQARVLDEHREFGIVYADSLLTKEPNERFETSKASLRNDWPDYTHGAGLSTCLFGPHPMWRRDVHDVLGGFAENFLIANDQDMFLRIAARFGAVHLRETLGLFLQRPDANSGSAKRALVIEEVMQVMNLHRSTMPLEVVFPALGDYAHDDRARVAVLFEMGNLCALGPYNDYKLALDFYNRGVLLGGALPGVKEAFASNVACVMHCAGSHDVSERALAAAGNLPAAVANAEAFAVARMMGRDAVARELSFASIEHPVVTASRRTRGLVVQGDGQIVWGEDHEQAPWDVYDGPDGVPVTEQDFILPGQPVVVQAAKEHVMIVMYGWRDSGGGTILPFDVAHGFAQRGHRVTVFYAGAKARYDLPEYGVERTQVDGIDVVGIFNRPSLFMDVHAPDREVDDRRIFEVFASLLDEQDPGIVHFFNLHNLGMSLPTACKQRGIPTVLSTNNYWAACPRLYLFDDQLNLCSGPSEDGSKCVTCLGARGAAAGYSRRLSASRTMLREGIDIHLAVSEKAREIHLGNGADAKGCQVLQQQPASLDKIWQDVGSKRKIIDVLDRPLVIGLIGSLFPHKGAHILAAALQAFPKGTVRGVFHGEVTLECARALREIDKNDVIELTGAYSLEQLPGLLASVDVVVVPSVWEDCAPFVVAEALASRAPVIGSRMGGIPDFVSDGVTGFLFESGNGNDLAQKILPFLANNHLLGQMQSSIEAPAGFQSYLDQLTGVYRSLVAAPAPEEVACEQVFAIPRPVPGQAAFD